MPLVQQVPDRGGILQPELVGQRAPVRVRVHRDDPVPAQRRQRGAQAHGGRGLADPAFQAEHRDPVVAAGIGVRARAASSDRRRSAADSGARTRPPVTSKIARRQPPDGALCRPGRSRSAVRLSAVTVRGDVPGGGGAPDGGGGGRRGRVSHAPRGRAPGPGRSLRHGPARTRPPIRAWPIRVPPGQHPGTRTGLVAHRSSGSAREASRFRARRRRPRARHNRFQARHSRTRRPVFVSAAIVRVRHGGLAGDAVSIRGVGSRGARPARPAVVPCGVVVVHRPVGIRGVVIVRRPVRIPGITSRRPRTTCRGAAGTQPPARRAQTRPAVPPRGGQGPRPAKLARGSPAAARKAAAAQPAPVQSAQIRPGPPDRAGLVRPPGRYPHRSRPPYRGPDHDRPRSFPSALVVVGE